MGFMDKAKKMAEQAQAKLEEAQQQFNDGQQGDAPPSGPAQDYDQHGRPVPAPDPGPPHGDPLAAGRDPARARAGRADRNPGRDRTAVRPAAGPR